MTRMETQGDKNIELLRSHLDALARRILAPLKLEWRVAPAENLRDAIDSDELRNTRRKQDH
ncbi:hypothetical protein [Paraburkholderia dipogonis]|uniref:hypothetical protein n=1 Tax=Paraburkholderia dipogonis TaxID=1211383 RepID=UPI0038BA4807